MFTLDETTLFYYFLSTAKKPQNASTMIKGWAAGVKPGVPPKQASSRSSVTSAVHSKVTATTLGNNVGIVTKKSKLDPGSSKNSVVTVNELGGVSDDDETFGEERLAAVDSPFKGKRRATSAVFLFL